MLLTLLAGCSKGPQADLQYISKARSIAAEWALVNAQAGQGKLTDNYVSTMRQAAQEQLQTTKSALSQPQSPYGHEIDALLAMPPDAPTDAIRAHAVKLKQIEDGLESD